MNRVTAHPLFHAPDYPASQPLDSRQMLAIHDLNARLANGSLTSETVPCLCGGADFDLVASFDRYRVAQDTVLCRHCGLMLSRPRMSPATLSWFYGSDAYRRIYGGGNLLPHTGEKFLANAANARLYTLLGQHLDMTEIGSVAEIGCGAGWKLWEFHQAGKRVLGCDYSPELTAAGREAGLDIRQGTAGQAFTDEKADLVILSHVVEHFSDPAAEVIAISDRLSAQFLYIEVPNVDFFCSDFLQSAHLYYFSPATLIHYMAKAGLAAVTVIPRGCHFGVIFKRGEAPPAPDLSAEYRRVVGIVRRYERRETVKTWLRRAGIFPVAQWVASVLRAIR